MATQGAYHAFPLLPIRSRSAVLGGLGGLGRFSEALRASHSVMSALRGMASNCSATSEIGNPAVRFWKVDGVRHRILPTCEKTHCLIGDRLEFRLMQTGIVDGWG